VAEAAFAESVPPVPVTPTLPDVALADAGPLPLTLTDVAAPVDPAPVIGFAAAPWLPGIAIA
jgi:hypothetical protein